MKKIFKIYIVLAVLGVFTFSGCSGILDEQPRTIITPEFFQTANGLRSGLTASYAHFRRFIGTEGGMRITVFGTDEYHNGQQVNNPPFQIYSSITPELGQPSTIWNNAYPAINTCNGIIEIGANATDLPEAEKEQLIAEAKYIRAHWYFYLVTTFGDCTLDLGSGELAFNTTPSNDLVRAPAAAVYEAIINDLEEAAAVLPDSRGIPGRAWKATALHLLSKVYLTRGWLNNDNGDFQSALATAQELINNASDFDVALEPIYANVFTEGNEWGPEVLFTVEWNGNQQFNEATDSGHFTNNIANFLFREFYVQDVPGMIRDVKNGRPWIRFSPTPWLLDVAFEDKVNDERYAGSFQDTWIANDENASVYPVWTSSDVSAGYVDASMEGQPKYQFGDTALHHFPKHVQDQFASAQEAMTYGFSKGYYFTFPDYGTNINWADGVGRNFQNKHFPSLSKFNRVARPIAGTEEDPNIGSTRPFIVFRFAETYLIAAEAALKLGQNDLAVQMINVIRNRANAIPITAGDLVGDHGDEIDFLLDERSRELAGEMHRWHDLARTRRLLARVSSDPSVGTGAPAVHNRNYNGGAPAAGQTAPKPLPHHYLRPVPQNAIDGVVGNYGQNEGY